MAKKTKKVVNPRVARTRNAGTMTEAMFWTMIRSALRQSSRWWKPAGIAKQKARRKYFGPNKLQKWEYQCNQCKEWFKEKEIAIDHVVECGQLKCAEDLPGFIERLFCEEGFQVLCKKNCHHTKTQEYIKYK